MTRSEIFFRPPNLWKMKKNPQQRKLIWKTSKQNFGLLPLKQLFDMKKKREEKLFLFSNKVSIFVLKIKKHEEKENEMWFVECNKKSMLINWYQSRCFAYDHPEFIEFFIGASKKDEEKTRIIFYFSPCFLIEKLI